MLMKTANGLLYQTVKQALLEQIRRGDLRPGQRIPSHKILATKLAVSEGTVSRAVSELAREGFLEARRRKGVRVLDPKVSKATGSVAFLLNSAHIEGSAGSPIFRLLFMTLQEKLGGQGYEVTTLAALKGANEFSGWVPAERLWGRNFVGIFVMNVFDLEYLSTLKSVSAPIVVLDRDTLDVGMDCVVFDNLGSSFQLTQHLIRQGHREIAFMGGLDSPLEDARPSYDPATSERHRGYRLALESAGIPYRPELVAFAPGISQISGGPIVQLLLSRRTPFTALVTEFGGPLVKKAVLDAGLENVSMVGWLWGDERQGLECSDAYAHFDLVAMGEAAAQILENKVNRSSKKVERIVLPGKIQVIRENRLS